MVIICFVAGNNIFAQNKRTYISLNTGLFVPGNDFIIGGWKTTGYDANGSPVDVSVNGFGTGGNFSISFHHYFSNIGIRLKSGVVVLRQDIGVALAPNGEMMSYDNTLNIVPAELSLACKINLDDSKVVPYFGTGIGIYYGAMETKRMPENGQRTWLKDEAFSGGVTCYSGIFIPVYFELLLNLDIGYNVAIGTWELKDQDDDTITKYEDLNTGGFTFNIGLAFRF